MTTRDLEPYDIEILYEGFARRAIEQFNEKKECAPQLVAVTMGNERGTIDDLIGLDPELVNALQRDGRRKDMLMMIVSAMLSQKGLPGINAVVHMTEVWISRALESQDDQRTRGLLAGDLTPSDDPERGEAIAVFVHTKDHTYLGHCPITGSGAERSAEFEPLQMEGDTQGRFSMQERAGHGTH